MTFPPLHQTSLPIGPFRQTHERVCAPVTSGGAKGRELAPPVTKWHLVAMSSSFSLYLLRPKLRWLYLALVGAQLALGACAEREVPEDAINGLLRATLEKDRDAIWDRLSPTSQNLLERLAAEDAVFKGGSKRPAKERLLDDGLQLNVGFAKLKEMARNGDDVLFVATDHKGHEKEIHVRRIDNRWRLQLPGADPAGTPDPFAAARRRHAKNAP